MLSSSATGTEYHAFHLFCYHKRVANTVYVVKKHPCLLAKMSESSLSPALNPSKMSLMDLDSLYSSQLTTAAFTASSLALQLPSTPTPYLRSNSSALFPNNLYILNTVPLKVHYVCTQPTVCTSRS